MMIPKQETSFQKNNQTAALLIAILVLSIPFLMIGCSSENKQVSTFVQPDYIDRAMDKVSKFRDNNNHTAVFKYIDSIRAENFDKGAVHQYHIYYLYQDAYSRIEEKDKSIVYIDSMRLILDRVNNDDLLYKEYISVNYYKADILFEKKRFNDAYLYYYNALSLSRKYNDSCDQYYYYLVLAHVMYKNEQYADGLRYYTEANNLLANCTTKFWTYYRRQQALNNIGLCYERLGMYDSSITMYTKTIKHINDGYTQFPRDKHRLIAIAKAVAEGNLGSVYLKAGKYAEAEALLKRSIDTNGRKGKDEVDAQYNRIKLATVYMNTNRPQLAKDLLDKVKVISDTIKNSTVDKRWNKAMWQYWEGQNSPINAYQNLSAYQKLTEQLQKEQAEFSVADIDARVSNIAKEYQIKTLKENAVTRKIYLAIALIVSTLALIIVFLVVQILRKSRRHVRMLKVMNQRISEQQKKLKTTYDDLENSDNEKDRILKAVSHDMRSPINSALALTDLLESSADNLNEEQKEYIQLIKSSCNNALSMTKDLLEIATLSTTPLVKELVNVNEFISNSVELIRYRAAQKQQNILLSKPSNVVSAHINEEKMSRVVNNLITNAIKFSPENSDIHVIISKDEDKLKIEVRDNGIGIPIDIRPKIFDLFTEAKRFGTSGEQPYGLGLSISKQIVESHNGEIWFNTEDGKGTSFFISFPLN